MALQDVLTVLGEAILSDAGAEEVARIIAAAPGLTPAEREDLARIPYARLRPYQSDYYTFERGMVQWAFEHTWGVLKAIGFGGLFGEGERAAQEFMVQFRTSCRNETHSTREMAGHFCDFLRGACGPIVEEHPWLLELARAERHEVEVLYEADRQNARALAEDDLAGLFDQTVDDLFASNVVMAEARLLHTRHDILAIKAAFRTAKRIDAGAVAEAERIAGASTPQWLLLARDHDRLQPVWYRVDESFASRLQYLSVGGARTLEEHLWQVFPDGVETEERLGDFMAYVHRSLRLRAMLLAA